MTYLITQNCCNDATCVSVCPVNCIHPTPDEPGYRTAEMLYIDPEVCIDCGACADACPVDAVLPDFDVTPQSEPYEEINAHYYTDPAHKDYEQSARKVSKPKIQVAEGETLRVAIVGSGPAAFYAAEELLTRKGVTTEVHMFERLPTPFGLVRFGVAPDHQSTKSVADAFSRTAGRRGMTMHLNVEVGKDITHEELLERHHAVIYAVGASADRRLGIPGEDLPGSCSATEFVAWYNGHPDHAEREFDLSSERAVVVGNGNVALDVARILVQDIDALARTDIAEHALAALAESKIREVVVLGRRGPAQAAFTTPELLGLTAAGVNVVVDPAEARLDSLTEAGLADGDVMAALKARLIAERALPQPESSGDRRIVLRFLRSPAEIVGTSHVEGLRIVRNELSEAADGRLVARATDDDEYLDCGLVLRSVGYRGKAVADVPFDETAGVIPNRHGRVIDTETGAAVSRIYTAGWMKRGPSGVIGTNKQCSEETVAAIFEDFTAGRLGTPAVGTDDIDSLIAQRQPEAFGFSAWQVLDRHEKALAKPHKRPRVKLSSIPAMLEIVHGADRPVAHR